MARPPKKDSRRKKRFNTKGAPKGQRETAERQRSAQEKTPRPDRSRTGAPSMRPQAQGSTRNNKSIGRHLATLQKNPKGFGFLIFDNRTLEDLYLPAHQAATFFHGDRIEVTLDSRNEIANLELKTRRFEKVFCQIVEITKTGAIALFEHRQAQERIEVVSPLSSRIGDWVQLQLRRNPVTGVTQGTIERSLGKTIPASSDLDRVALEHGLIEHHSEAAEREAQLLTAVDHLEPPRIDHTHIPFITIDGEDARDFDDAVYVERQPAGFFLWVAIADVSWYVREGTELDKTARERATSVYFPERAFHMLPRRLAEDLCSLRPNLKRPALTARIQFDAMGKRKATQLYESIIFSRRRATYNEIQKEWEQEEHRPMVDLYRLIRKTRENRGSLDFDLAEAKVTVDETGDPITIERRERLEAHRLIEEFMISANEAVTEYMQRRSNAFVWRIHEPPSERALLAFEELAETYQMRVQLTGLDAKTLQKNLSYFLRKTMGHPDAGSIHFALLRSLKQANYSSKPGEHFGLASIGYTHFTSPIRRYPDLVVHRLVRQALRTKAGSPSAWQNEKDIQPIVEHCNFRERLAADAERDSIKTKQARIMLKHLGQTFDAKISSKNENGISIVIDTPYIEGYIPAGAFMPKVFKKFHAGLAIQVRVDRADPENRKIEFSLVSDK